MNAFLNYAAPGSELLSHQLLKPEGSLFLHWTIDSVPYARLLMDEIFGEENFLNEIIWVYKSGGRAKQHHFSRKHDTILLYKKSKQHYFNPDAVGKPRGLVQT
jgi:site-specific DNA-methyltransferase (adenine-specific)